uniref:Uncharacterized protein n=1 Tax=Sphenodon punctatus TaxID=8508 RepID=A0A8D0GTA9_SPHPU
MKKSSFWKIFDRLFSPSESPEKVLTSSPAPARARSSLGSRSEMGGNGVKTPPTLRYAPRPPSPTEPDSPQQQRRDLYHAIRSHIWQEHGRAQIHGWSQPPSWQGRDPSVGNNQVPVLTQLRLLDQKDPSTKLWCAAAAVARTVGSGDPDTMGSSGCSSSPALWVASGTPAASEISLLDAQSPNQLLQHFVLTSTHVLCLACLPGLAPPEGGGSNFEPEIVDNPLAPGPDNDGEATETGGVGTKPTLWLGTQEGSIYIHTAESDWRRCQKKVQLKDAIHSIIHAQGRAVAALGDGSLAIFHRDADCCWDLLHPRLVELGRPRCSVRCALPVSEQIWCGFRNRVYVVDPRFARIQRYFEVTPHAESQVRHMAASNTGVWVSVRLQATLRLLHVETGQPLQEVELVPFITRTLGPSSLALSLHISALGTFGNRLWVGTSGGIVIAVPFTQDVPGTSEPPSLTGAPPCCAMELAQISYHAHRDAVRFFISVPGCLNSLSAGSHENLHQDGLSQPSALVLSGGEGYINLRIGDNSDERYGDLLLANPRLRRAERSHLIVWQIQA